MRQGSQFFSSVDAFGFGNKTELSKQFDEMGRQGELFFLPFDVFNCSSFC